MTADQFRKLALSLPETVEAAHMGHPDFRVGGRIFATLGYKDARTGMVKLTVEQQLLFIARTPEVFAPVPGGWGRKGATEVRLRAATRSIVLPALETAWRNTAPKRLLSAVR
jgi:hypothetical protein